MNLPITAILSTFAKDAGIDDSEATSLFREHLQTQLKEWQYNIMPGRSGVSVHKFFCRVVYFFLVGSYHRHNIYDKGTHRRWNSAKDWAKHVLDDSLERKHEKTLEAIRSALGTEFP